MSLKNVVGFEGSRGLFEDLASGHVPQFSLITPNQCHDQHGRGNAGPACDFDPSDDGSLAGLNPGLIFVGDLSLRNIVNAIHKSPAWREGGKMLYRCPSSVLEGHFFSPCVSD